MPTFPNIPFTNMSLSSNNPTRVTKSINGIEQRDALGSQYYSLNVTFQNLSKANQRTLMGFIDEMQGPLTAFDIALPSYLGNSTGVYTGTISVPGSHAVGSTTVNITTPTAGVGDIVLKAGDLVRFSNHSKVYSVKSDRTANPPSAVTLTLNQALRSAVSAVTLVHQSLTMSVRFADDISNFQVDQREYATFSLTFNEVLV